MENKYEGMPSFQRAALISDVLSAAAEAAVRRFEIDGVDLSEQADAVCVLTFVEEQRAFMHDQEKRGHANGLQVSEKSAQPISFDERLKSADCRSSQQKLEAMVPSQTHPDDIGRE